jgi:hypothetical protein
MKKVKEKKSKLNEARKLLANAKLQKLVKRHK